MIKKILFTIFAALFVLSLSAAELKDFSRHPKLHENKVRKQRLVFVPDKLGSNIGSWRICWENGDKSAELLLPSTIKLPAFKKKLRIEMDLLCSDGFKLRSVDLRLLDAGGEVCAFNSSRTTSASGAVTAVWEITHDQKVFASWGRNVNKKLDFPISITNFAFSAQHPIGDVTVNSLRIICDSEK